MGGAEAEDEEDADEDEDAAAARRAAAALEEQLEALPGLIWDLGQQLGDLSLESGGLEQESGRSSGFYEDPSSTGGPDSPPSTFCGDSGFSGSGSYGRLGPSEPRGIYASERPKSLGSDSECSAGRLGPLGRRGPTGGVGGGYGESESSASEAESPAFSSASSDSDGSGGLVWPQQLVAATAASGPAAGAGGGAPAGPAKVFVKIKASHALKKKILRFRSGSLKVMTTVDLNSLFSLEPPLIGLGRGPLLPHALSLGAAMSNNMAKIAEARKTVEQLKLEVNIDRMKVSQAAAELLAFCETHAKDDPLMTPVPAAENPFRDKRLFCVLL
ncbi:Guanine nucleotide-binding protein G subunit gamma-8 [Camelus dromedarius]|uniref:Guanine nucleotide-binding protein subunit gamma n=5 Tax=Camelus TaxID=9836 RepID=A0A5N4DTD0_CAMDR|nr:Guanine nucleotide-binding protein G subunit gamma-8 [Camelus dromedarius]